jgi:hypothetical protein
MLTLMVLSPVPAAIGLLAYFFIERSRTAGAKPNFGSFISTVGFWAVGALVLAGIIATAVLGAFYDAANAPFAFLVYGPPAFSVGAIAGAVRWRKKMAKPNPD